jgi:tRNA pseudouridine synthase 8/2,5-diamino-6-(5-phospho-D-ribitylamino)-pyrimidin-4(3H)-one deaminase
VKVHAAGPYNMNSVLNILRYEHNLMDVNPINRLDRLTSGVLILPRNHDLASRISEQLREHVVQKEYIAKVQGEFPENEVVVDKALSLQHGSDLGVYHSSIDTEAGRHTITKFQRMLYNKETNSSLVKCLPVTGRTHQIRVHLQHLGHPIVNDPIYNTEFRTQFLQRKTAQIRILRMIYSNTLEAYKSSHL